MSIKKTVGPVPDSFFKAVGTTLKDTICLVGCVHVARHGPRRPQVAPTTTQGGAVSYK
jgi:hypothetical protein